MRSLSRVLLPLFSALCTASISIPIIPREDIIAFQDIPDCTNTTCFPFHSSSIGCPRFSQSCFCSALQPFKCAYTTCLGNEWYGLEDWYASVCPEIPTVDFSRFARCGRECIRNSIVPSWCNATVVGTNTPTRNCFCRITEPGFVGFDDCMIRNCEMNRTDAQTYLSEFWNDICLLPPDGESGSHTDVSDQVVQFPRLAQPQSTAVSQDGPLAKAEPVGLIVGLIASFVTIIGVAWAWWKRLWCFRRRRESDEPPPYGSRSVWDK